MFRSRAIAVILHCWRAAVALLLTGVRYCFGCDRGKIAGPQFAVGQVPRPGPACRNGGILDTIADQHDRDQARVLVPRCRPKCEREQNTNFVGWVSALARNPTWEPRNVGLRAGRDGVQIVRRCGRANPTYVLYFGPRQNAAPL